jgi:hypothetical protein
MITLTTPHSNTTQASPSKHDMHILIESFEEGNMM